MSPGSVPVSVVIPTLNEADRLPACLDALGWAAEVIVCDGGSVDGTTAYARRRGARVISVPGVSIGAQRNAGIAAASQPWILAVDADERVGPALVADITRVLDRPEAEAYSVRVRNKYLGQEVVRGSWARETHLRFFRRHLRFSERHVHEGLCVEGPTGQLDGWLEHDTYRSLTHQLEKATKYAAWGARDLQARGRKASLFGDLIARPVWRFIRRYVIDGAWRDGRRGLVFAAVDAWSGFAKYAQLWYLEESRMTPAAKRGGRA